MGLTAVSYLGLNTVSILDELAAYLTETTGIDMKRAGPPRSSTQAIEADRDTRGDVVWACGHLTMQLRASDPGCLEIIGAPVFTGQSGPVYHAVVVARREGPTSLIDALDLRLGVNEIESWSGHLGLRAHLGQQGSSRWFSDVTLTGSHLESVEALATGSVGVISVDNTVWEQLLDDPPESIEPHLAGLVIIDRTVDWPAPPISIGGAVGAEASRQIRSALGSLGAGDVVGLDAVRESSHLDYAVMAG
ncbi:MAG: phosphate/phosphite/phosphonate ABC transporter substrate-binding protein [Acidimicrobiales bacterium]